MKKIFFVLFFLFFSASLTYAETTIYSNSKDFLIAEGYDCVSASDGCNTVQIVDGKLGAMTMMYCEDIYGTAGHEKWSCLKKKDIAIVGNDKDEHGCIGSAGYSWNQDKQACIKPWEEAEDEVKICTMQYDPVCGVDSKTYGNACSAGKVEIAYKGECNLSSLTNEETKDYEYVKTELNDKTKLDLKARLEKFSKSFSSLSKIKKERLKKQIDLLIVKNIRNLEKKDSLSQVENTMKNTLKMIRYEIKDMKI